MGAYLAEPQKTKKTKQDKGNKLVYCSSQMQGWRKTMQDADIHQLDIGDGNALFGVFDGHGGFQVSKYVEKIFKDTLISLQSYKKKQYKEALIQCFKIIDQKIVSEQGERSLKQIRGGEGPVNQNGQLISSTTGCTANVILITNTEYYVANIGDSRSALLCGQKAIQLSFDHKPQSQVQRKRIQRAGGQISMGRVNGGLNLSRSFGDFDYKQTTDFNYKDQMITCNPDVLMFERKPQDKFIIMGCDGIWEKYVDNCQGLVDLVKGLQGRFPNNDKEVVEQLLEELIAKESKEGVGCDNMTAILIHFN